MPSPSPAGSGDELARRFAARIGAVDSQDGFEGFELLQPTDERTHLARRHPLARRGRVPGLGQLARLLATATPGANAPHGASADARWPASSELWSYTIAQTAGTASSLPALATRR